MQSAGHTRGHSLARSLACLLACLLARDGRESKRRTVETGGKQRVIEKRAPGMWVTFNLLQREKTWRRKNIDNWKVFSFAEMRAATTAPGPFLIRFFFPAPHIRPTPPHYSPLAPFAFFRRSSITSNFLFLPFPALDHYARVSEIKLIFWRFGDCEFSVRSVCFRRYGTATNPSPLTLLPSSSPFPKVQRG